MCTCFVDEEVKAVLPEDVQVVDQDDLITGRQFQVLGTGTRQKQPPSPTSKKSPLLTQMSTDTGTGTDIATDTQTLAQT